jgi:hypothetical protein
VTDAGKPFGGLKVSIEGSTLTSTTTDAGGNYSFGDLRAGGSYIITPRGQTSFKPANRSFDNLRRDEPADFFRQSDATPTPTPTPTPKQECSEADSISALNTLRSFAPRWQRQIQGERAKIIAENVPNNIENAEASVGEIEFQYSFPKPCKAALVRATYVWQVHYSSPITPGKTKSVSRQRLIGCGKFLGAWVCN